MAKLYKTNNHREGEPDLNFYCPGCECDHGVWVNPHSNGGATWNWNNDMDSPTFTPSLLIRAEMIEICHIIITNGKIHYQPDCTHKFAGQVIDMEEI